MEYNPDLLPIIKTIDEHFEIPQLIRTRRITALLPWNYHETDKRYPVLYLQDGQNLFDDYAPFGSWGVNKKLAALSGEGKGDVIIIAIDHAESDRIAEFTPTAQTKLGSGDGKKYARFLAETLKPFVDENFRTLPERKHTGIGGSSMGGLVSVYATLQYPHVYRKLMIFSPSFWVTPNMPRRFIYENPDFNGEVYLYCGTNEGSNLVEYLNAFEQAADENPHDNDISVKVNIKEGGEHNEYAWGEAFSDALEWLFYRNKN